MKEIAIVRIGESWFAFWPTVMMLEIVKKKIKETIRQLLLTALVVFLVIAALSLVAAIFIFGDIGLILKIIFVVVAASIVIFLLAFSFWYTLKLF